MMACSSSNNTNVKPYPHGIVINGDSSDNPPSQPSSSSAASTDDHPSPSDSNPLTMVGDDRCLHHRVLTGGDPDEAFYSLYEVIHHVLELVRDVDDDLVCENDERITTEDDSFPKPPHKKNKKEQDDREGHDHRACQ